MVPNSRQLHQWMDRVSIKHLLSELLKTLFSEVSTHIGGVSFGSVFLLYKYFYYDNPDKPVLFEWHIFSNNVIQSGLDA